MIDLYEDGITIESAVKRNDESRDEQQRAIERAVSRMLDAAPEQLGREARNQD